MKWVPIAQADKTQGNLLVWIPGTGPVSHCRWDLCEYHQKPKPYWTTMLERPYGVAWQRANQPTHFAVDVPGP